MSAPLAFRVQLGALRPACPVAEEALRALGNGALCGVTLRKSSRNLRRLRFYRMMLAVAAPLLAEHVPGLTAADLHDIVRKKLKLGDEMRLPSGETHFRPRSTSFAAMDEAAFAAHVNRVGCAFGEVAAMSAGSRHRRGQRPAVGRTGSAA